MINQINPGDLWCSLKSFKHQSNSIMFLQMPIANINDEITYFIIWFREKELELYIDDDAFSFSSDAKQL